MNAKQTLIGFALAALGATSMAAQQGVARTADGKPDLNGIWQALNTANYDILSHQA